MVYNRRLARSQNCNHFLQDSLGLHQHYGGFMRTTILALGLLGVLVTPAFAGRPVTDEERTKLVEALKAQGCTGGKMEFDSNKFEVDDATCADGKKYDLDFDQAFALLKKKLD
jgi:hypothetical protein